MPLLVLFLAGCARSAPPPSDRAPHESSAPESISSAKPTSTPHADLVAVTALLTAYDPNFAWHDDSAEGQDDGVAPLATFEVRQPATFRGRPIRVLFKYDRASARPISDTTPLRSAFTLSVPRDYFDQASPVPLLDNSLVGDLALAP